VRNTVRTLRNETTAAVQALEAARPDITIQDLMPLVSGRFAREAYTSGDCARGLLSAGQSLAFTDRIEPLADIVARLEDDMARAFARMPAPRSAEAVA